jgi:hypothetical protein
MLPFAKRSIGWLVVFVVALALFIRGNDNALGLFFLGLLLGLAAVVGFLIDVIATVATTIVRTRRRPAVPIPAPDPAPAPPAPSPLVPPVRLADPPPPVVSIPAPLPDTPTVSPSPTPISEPPAVRARETESPAPVTRPRAEPARLFVDSEPADGATIFGDAAWVRWRARVGAMRRVLWRRHGTTEWSSVDVDNHGDALARLAPLQAERQYEYVIEETVDATTSRSEPSRFTVQSGLTLVQSPVAPLPRDYDLSVPLTFRNGTSVPRTLAARVLNRFDDLPADVVGAGSLDEPVAVAPGAELALRLAVNAADARRHTYEIPVDAAGIVAVARIEVERPPLKLVCSVSEVDGDPVARRITIRNDGATINDLAVAMVPPNDRDVRLAPGVSHGRLPAGEALELIATPVLYLEFVSLDAEIECSSAGQTVRFPVSFRVPEGLRLIGIRMRTQYRGHNQDWYCTNKPTTCSELPGPEGTGPA